MAIARQTVQDMLIKLEHDYHHARTHYASRGEHAAMDHCDRTYAKELDHIKRSYHMDDMYSPGLLGGTLLDPRHVFGNGGGSMLNAAQNQMMNAAQNQLATGLANSAALQNAATKPAEAEEGVLMFRGAPLPDKWMGAHYDTTSRAVVGRQWKISFMSDHSSDTIMLWLSVDQYSGNDADKVAATYLETINQRRLG